MNFNLGQALSIVLKTLPFLILRLGVYFIFMLGFILYLCVLYFIANGLAAVHEAAQPLVWIIGLAVSFPLVQLVREYILYLCKAAHVAVIAELAMNKTLPQGISQISWGRQKVQEKFKESSALFLMDRLVSGVISVINGMLWKMGNLFSAIPGMKGLTNFAQLVLKLSMTYIDEAILARNFLTPNEPMWDSAKTGLILYAQSWKEVLKVSFVLGMIVVVIYPIFFVILLGPALGLGALYPDMQPIFIIGAALFAYVLKAAFLDPWTLTVMILTYLKTTQGLVPNAEWENRLSTVSKKFREIKAKALEPVSSENKIPAV